MNRMLIVAFILAVSGLLSLVAAFVLSFFVSMKYSGILLAYTGLVFIISGRMMKKVNHRD